MLNCKPFALTSPRTHDRYVKQSWTIAILILLFGVSQCSNAEPLLITSGNFTLGQLRVDWAFAGDGFSSPR